MQNDQIKPERRRSISMGLRLSLLIVRISGGGFSEIGLSTMNTVQNLI
jgi:hypothetical protein